MVELGRRQGHTRPNAAKNFFSHQSIGAWVQVALQVAPNLVVLVTKSVWVVRVVGIQQQAGRLNRPCRDDHCFRARNMRFSFASLLNEIGYADDVAPLVRLDPFSYGASYELTMAGGQGAGNRR